MQFMSPRVHDSPVSMTLSARHLTFLYAILVQSAVLSETSPASEERMSDIQEQRTATSELHGLNS